MRRPREGTNKSRPDIVRRSRMYVVHVPLHEQLLAIWKGCINDSFFGFEFLMEKN